VAAERRDSRAFLAWACVATLATAALFYWPGREASGGDWPAPLDDVYIHYDFARSLASGHPFEWIAGQGYSSGETSPAYAFVLAIGYVAGFHGLRLGVWAALLACASLVATMWMLRRVINDVVPGSHVSWLVAPLLLSSGTLDFACFSGMEVALFAVVAGALVLAVERARAAGPIERSHRQWWVGVLGALLVLVRPESAIVVAVATFTVARRIGTSSAVAACARVASPGALATLGVAAANWLGTGETASAGALLKLLSSNPFATDVDRARDYVVNIGSFLLAMRHDLGTGTGHLAWLLPLLACASLASRKTRALGALCLGGALAFTLLVSWNGAARYQNLRDYMPAVLLLLFASALGLAVLTQPRPLRPRVVARAFALAGIALALVGIALGASHVAEAAQLYARASRNIHDQQVTVGRRLAATSAPDAIVLVGDAGAIPYLSGLHAVDALGLGGYHRVPFVRAAVHGEAATLELIERLPEDLRPTVLALYPNWFPGITSTFGHERDRVTIEDNVICGGVTKVVYDADWSGMRGDTDASDEPWSSAVVDELDVADIVSEETHAYTSPAPRGGFTLFDVRTLALGDGVRRFDAGRIIPEGEEESFTALAAVPAGGTLVLRVDEAACELSMVVVPRTERAFTLEVMLPAIATRAPSRWRVVRATLQTALLPGDRIRIHVLHGALHDFHAWLLAGKP